MGSRGVGLLEWRFGTSHNELDLSWERSVLGHGLAKDFHRLDVLQADEALLVDGHQLVVHTETAILKTCHA